MTNYKNPYSYMKIKAIDSYVKGIYKSLILIKTVWLCNDIKLKL